MDDYEIDYKRMFELMSERVEQIYAQQTEFFELLSRVNELAPYQHTIAKHLLKLEIGDKITLLKMNVTSGELSKRLCEKYNIDVNGSEESHD